MFGTCNFIIAILLFFYNLRIRSNRKLLWDFFEKSEDYQVNKEVNCKLCEVIIKSSGDTSNMETHLRQHFSNIY